jgi:photosystem II stability/assembly factor-like uncharacterized protein
LVAVAGGFNSAGPIWSSTNAGATWTQATAPLTNWFNVASSANGTKLAAATLGGPIYTSADSGASWTLSSAPNVGWAAIASSADGARLVAAGNGVIYTSTNSGATWSLAFATATSVSWISVSSAADGSKLVAAAFGGPIYTSTNAGATWTNAGAPSESWQAVAGSADGTKLVAVYLSNGAICTSQSTPTTSLSLVGSGSHAVISWIIPSMAFTLQQNSNLTATNWTDVTTTPVLNLTNLQNQVIVSPIDRAGFYRLKH